MSAGTLRERIENRLRDRIVAEEQAAGGPGRLDLGPLFERLDEVITVVEGIRDYSVEPYQDRVREIVCSTCRVDENGCCVTRDRHLCGLDKHFATIVAVIETELKADPGAS